MNEVLNHRPLKSYALLGSGRVARHIEFYLQSLNLPVQCWSRRSGAPLKPVLAEASHVLLAISDSALSGLAQECAGDGRVVVHFSGSARIEKAFAAHPLMTFGADVQTLDWYRAIPFVVDEGVDFSRLLPGLPNASFGLNPGQRAYYHALCALAGNSTFMLWQNIAAEFEQRLHLPAGILSPFLHQTVANALGPEAASRATGPVARGDWRMVEAHLHSLSEKPHLLEAYRHFLNQAAGAGQKVPEALL